MRRTILMTAVAAAFPALIGFVWPGTVEWLTTRGVKQYNAGEFGEAEKFFTRALEAEPRNATLQFNRGTALQRQGSFDAAAEAFTAAADSTDEGLTQDATYDLGNARFRAGDFSGAIEAYKQALRMDPQDGHARFNLELALQRQQEKEQQQEEQEDQRENDDQQQDQQDQQADNGEQQPEQDEQQQQDEDEQDGGGQDEQAQQPRPDEQEQDEQMSQPQQAEEGELTQAQAERLLHALASQDAEMQKLIRRAPQRRQPREGEKDW